jgi:hypothetical protein
MLHLSGSDDITPLLFATPTGWALLIVGTLTATAADANLGTGGDWDHVSNPFGHDGGGSGDMVVIADGHATATGTAFNMDIAMGANLQQNAVNVDVVGGNSDNDNISGDHHGG